MGFASKFNCNTGFKSTNPKITISRVSGDEEDERLKSDRKREIFGTIQNIHHSKDDKILKKRSHRMAGRKSNGRSSHAQPKVFRCPLESCGKIFHDRASLKKHNTVHGDKLF